MKNKKELIYIFLIIVLLGACGKLYFQKVWQPAHQIQVFYNQDKELNKELIQLTREADQFVYFAVYTFTRTDLKDALLAAKYRGLKVVGLTDKTQSKDIDLQKQIVAELKTAGIPVFQQDHLGIMHLKVLVTEKAYASGSYNWTAAATNLNDEVLEIGHDETLRQTYQNILEKLFNKYQ